MSLEQKVPSVDLLVPVYMAQRFLPRLKSQVSQLNPKFSQVLVYDDASPDYTFAAFERAGFTPIRGMRNLGPGGARNVLARHSKSEWIHFHDVDDEIAPDYLVHVLPLLSDDVDVVIHDVEFIDEATRAPEITFRAQPELEGCPLRSLLSNPMGVWSSVIRRERFLEIGGFDEAYRCFEDGDLHLRLAHAGARIRRLPLVLETSLRHGGGASANMAYCHKCRLRFLEKYLKSLPDDLLNDVRKEFLVTARGLWNSGDLRTAKQALDRYVELGGDFPVTQSRVLRLLGAVLPDIMTLGAQLTFAKLVGLLSRPNGR